MHKISLLKSLLIPTLGISAIGTIATSCACDSHSGVDIKVQSVELKSSAVLALGETLTLIPTIIPVEATNQKS